ncbi:MAG: hypothetical protein QM817_24975 [Archangium sp.]
MRIAAPKPPIPRCPPMQLPGGIKKHPPKHQNDGTFTVATINDDWATPKKSNFSWVKADVMLGQETKFAHLRAMDRFKDEKKFGVHQNFKDEAKAGSSIVWKKSDRIQAGKRGYELGVTPHGAKMLSRYINFTDMKIDGKNVRMVSVHRPPPRFKRLWPEFDRALTAFVKNTKGSIIIGMDSNVHNHRALARMTGLRWHGIGDSFDGFLTSRDVKFDNLHTLKNGSSDHKPVLARVHIKK